MTAGIVFLEYASVILAFLPALSLSCSVFFDPD